LVLERILNIYPYEGFCVSVDLLLWHVHPPHERYKILLDLSSVILYDAAMTFTCGHSSEGLMDANRGGMVMRYDSAYLYELQQMMGSMTSNAEAQAMADILKERGLDPQDMTDREFFALVAEAVKRA